MTKYGRNILSARSVNFDNFTLNLKMTKLNSRTKKTKSINRKMTISNLESWSFGAYMGLKTFLHYVSLWGHAKICEGK